MLIYQNTYLGGGRVFYVCHSMGCAEILALLSEFPEYNDRFDGLFLMAPPVFMRNSRARFLTGIANLAEDVWSYYEIRRPKPRPWYINCQNIFCRGMASMRARMLSVSYPAQLNMTMLPLIYDHLSQRSSSKVVYHFAQVSHFRLRCLVNYVSIFRLASM